MKPYLIGIAGPSGAGKSALAMRVAEALGAPVLSLDHYYRPHDSLSIEERARLNFDEPEALDSDLLAAHLQALAGGTAIEVPVYDFALHARRAETSAFAPARFIVVEGLFALYWEPVRRLMGTRVFVSAWDDVCFARRLERDVRERGRTPESVCEQYAATVRPMAERYVLPCRAFANVLASGTARFEDSVGAVMAHVAANTARPLEPAPLYSGCSDDVPPRTRRERTQDAAGCHPAGAAHLRSGGKPEQSGGRTAR